MKNTTRKLLYWSPRILCILFAMFLSLFALDVFSGNSTFWQSVLAFLIHLIPVYIVLLVLALSWRWEWIGGVLFIGLSLFYLIITWGRFTWVAYLTISGTAALLGVLFFLNWRYRAELRG